MDRETDMSLTLSHAEKACAAAVLSFLTITVMFLPAMEGVALLQKNRSISEELWYSHIIPGKTLDTLGDVALLIV